MKAAVFSLLCVLVSPLVYADDVRRITLRTNDIIYHPVTQKIYASVPSTASPPRANTVTWIDPVTGAIESSVIIGSEPNRLAISDDGELLYVGLDGAAAVRRFHIATETPGLQFPLGSDPFTGPYRAEDIEVLPGNSDAVAVSRRNVGFSPRHEGVAIYANGAQLPVTTPGHTGSNVIEFSNTSGTLYGYNNESSEFGFRRMSANENGVSVSDVTANLISGFGVDIEFEGGLIYATSGRVIDPETLTLVGTYPASGLVEPDSRIGRVFFLTGSGGTRTLVAFDQATFTLIGSLEIPGVAGTATSLVRWSEDGLAFRTTADQVFIIQTELARVDGPSFVFSPPTLSFASRVVGSSSEANALFVTNAGVAALTITQVELGGPNPGDFTIATDTCTGSALEPGARCFVELGFTPTAAGGRNASLTLTHNAGGSPHRVALSAVGTAMIIADEIRLITLAAQDVIYDPFTQKIYASVPGRVVGVGNTVTFIDPGLGVFESSIFMGSEPNRLAISDNGQFLYAGLDGAAAVGQLHVPTQTRVSQFPLGREPFTGPFLAEDIEVLPGNSDAVAVSRRNVGFSPRHEGVAIYANGAQLPIATPRHTGSNVIEFSNTSATLYGYNNETTEFGFRRMSANENGVSVSDVTANLISGFGVDIEFEGGLIYATSGRVIDPETLTLVGTYPASGLVEPDSTIGRVFFLTDSGGTRTLVAFDQATFTLIGSLEIPGVAGTATSLIRWGSDGVAFRTSGNQIYIIRSPLVQGTTGSDLEVSSRR